MRDVLPTNNGCEKKMAASERTSDAAGLRSSGRGAPGAEME